MKRLLNCLFVSFFYFFVLVACQSNNQDQVLVKDIIPSNEKFVLTLFQGVDSNDSVKVEEILGEDKISKAFTLLENMTVVRKTPDEIKEKGKRGNYSIALFNEVHSKEIPMYPDFSIVMLKDGTFLFSDYNDEQKRLRFMSVDEQPELIGQIKELYGISFN